MSSELSPPHADPLDGSLVIEARPTPGAGGPPPSTAEGPVFAVDWQVRPGAVEADRADPGLRPKTRSAAEATPLAFSIARALGTVVVSARGTLDDVGSLVLEHVLYDLIENQGNMTVVVDLHGVTDVVPGCQDIFVTANGWATIRGGQLTLTGARLRVARALEEAGVNRLVKVTSDRILAVPARPAVSREVHQERGSGPFIGG